MRAAYSPGISRLLSLFVGALLAASSASAATPQETVLYSFQGGNDGAYPASNLVADKQGNLYGTTEFGGTGLCTDADGFVIGCGTVFKLTKPAKSGGKWAESVLYSFQGFLIGSSNLRDSGYPQAGLAIDATGNLYGTNSGNTVPYYDNGNVFELSPPASSGGAWTETILYTFQGGYDGFAPRAGVIFDAKGHLYGSTSTGAPLTGGDVFRLTPPTTSGGAWTETVLYAFSGGTDGENPSGVLLDAKGTVFGTTSGGGGFGIGDQYTNSWYGGGTAFELSPNASSTKPWTETQAFVFPPCYENPSEGSACGTSTQPESALISDASGNLYGTTELGGAVFTCGDDQRDLSYIGCGTVFQLVPPAVAGGIWTQNVLYAFGPSSYVDGQNPLANVVFDKAGNLYGTTSAGGAGSLGAIFELSPPSTQGGSWTETILYNFAGGSDGAVPAAGLLPSSTGTFYSTTEYGGTGNCLRMTNQPSGCGTVFAIAP
jgi:uncharacterized repeat protein (TIGR03803 family)